MLTASGIPLLHAADVAATRAEVVQAIVLAQTPDVPAIRNIGIFPDVPPGHPYETFLLYAERIGIITPNTQHLLLPEHSVSRITFTVMMARAYHVENNTAVTFSDIPTDSWYAPYAGIAYTYHFFQLSDPTKFEPDRTVTMSEVNRAIILMQTLKANDSGPVRIDVPAPQKSATMPAIYTVTSIRRENVQLVAVPTEIRFPLVLRTPIVRPLTINEQRTKIFALINQARTDKGLKPLTYSIALEKSAQDYADRMATEGFFSHVAPDGQTVEKRIDATGFTVKKFQQSCNCVPGYALAENLAKGQKTAEEAVKDWLNSPEHRAAILNPAYTHTGIGLNAGIWVEHFGGVLLP